MTGLHHFTALCLAGMLSLAAGSARAEDGYAFGSAPRYQAAKGVVIEQLQRALGMTEAETMRCDTVTFSYFGPRTAAAVKAAQVKFGQTPDGFAGPKLFASLGLSWPDEIERAIQLTASCGFEGASFGHAMGSAETSSDDGVTWGIIGFTSYNGEVQGLLRGFKAQAPDRWSNLVAKTLSKERAADLEGTLIVSARDRALGDWALKVRPDGKKVALDDAQALFMALGAEPVMVRLQMDRARQRYWTRAALPLLMRAFATDEAGVDRLSAKAKALAYDMRVFSNGPDGNGQLIKGSAEERVPFKGFDKLAALKWTSEDERLKQIASVTIERLTLYWASPDALHVKGATRRWKTTIIAGSGPDADLRSFALVPR